MIKMAEKKPPKIKDIVDEVKADTMKEIEERKKLQQAMEKNPLPAFVNATKFRFIDITSELFREYVYVNGAKIRINFPMKLSVAGNNAHRVFDMKGLSYYIPPSWIGIVWKARPGAPNFIM